MSNTEFDEYNVLDNMDTDEIIQIESIRKDEQSSNTNENWKKRSEETNHSNNKEEVGDIEMECIEKLTGMSMNNHNQNSPRN